MYSSVQHEIVAGMPLSKYKANKHIWAFPAKEELDIKNSTNSKLAEDCLCHS